MANQVIILWSVLSIGYTPETYVVKYGTDESSLDTLSEELMSSEDYNAVDIPFSVTLSNLQPVTTYYYRVVATNSHSSTESDVGTFTTLARSESCDLS